jgi:hypothetical protein
MHTGRHTYIQGDTQTYIGIHRHTWDTYTDIVTHTDRGTHTQPEGTHTYRETHRQTHIHTGGHTDSHGDTHTDRGTDIQTMCSRVN